MRIADSPKDEGGAKLVNGKIHNDNWQPTLTVDKGSGLLIVDGHLSMCWSNLIDFEYWSLIWCSKWNHSVTTQHPWEGTDSSMVIPWQTKHDDHGRGCFTLKNCNNQRWTVLLFHAKLYLVNYATNFSTWHKQVTVVRKRTSVFIRY